MGGEHVPIPTSAWAVAAFREAALLVGGAEHVHGEVWTPPLKRQLVASEVNPLLEVGVAAQFHVHQQDQLQHELNAPEVVLINQLLAALYFVSEVLNLLVRRQASQAKNAGLHEHQHAALVTGGALAPRLGAGRALALHAPLRQVLLAHTPGQEGDVAGIRLNQLLSGRNVPKRMDHHVALEVPPACVDVRRAAMVEAAQAGQDPHGRHLAGRAAWRCIAKLPLSQVHRVGERDAVGGLLALPPEVVHPPELRRAGGVERLRLEVPKLGLCLLVVAGQLKPLCRGHRHKRLLTQYALACLNAARCHGTPALQAERAEFHAAVEALVCRGALHLGLRMPHGWLVALVATARAHLGDGLGACIAEEAWSGML
mmetsp:Transcript_16358/g.45064  ORF Transcript_16358/g.45064 Transcript_16358/m.45064 type:complete len:370 (-) Transcript_16358:26-1135(-)